ncbi:hypothetical protein N0B31_10255 [Salinirubellus salinus]|uniref:Uncharacterized protein n=1 Tax=Salinirubellus salinus TaxID=1364945 RepID=A0A9E7UCU5_9EURY|nr:hypothetical protein [Salinirubellus salinus]UWM56657.1 hypothetical protein N0B31_10255 [Salinirubellus salinus]
MEAFDDEIGSYAKDEVTVYDSSIGMMYTNPETKIHVFVSVRTDGSAAMVYLDDWGAGEQVHLHYSSEVIALMSARHLILHRL